VVREEESPTIRRFALAIVPAVVLACLILAGGGGAAGFVGDSSAVASAPLVPASTVKRAAGVSGGAVYPLKVGVGGRYLVDQQNNPFLLVGDAPQSMFVNLSEEQAGLYLRDRAAAGFNAIWVNLLCTTYTGGRPSGSTYDGIAPFKSQGDLSLPNEQYFRRVDSMIRLAAKQGIVVFLDPIETGGWLSTLIKNGVAADYAYGRYLGARYRAFPNIVWLNGNDFQSWRDPGADAAVRAVARGIKSTDPRHLQTIELDYDVSSSLDDARWRSLIGVDSAYTYAPAYAELLRDYARHDVRPTILIEANYEFGKPAVKLSTLRNQEYWTALSGSSGQFYGNDYTWPFRSGWRTHLDTPGSRQLGYLTGLLSGRRWYDLIPDTSHQVVTAGYGTFSDSQADINVNDYVTAARTSDGTLAIAYLPAMNTVTVDLGTFPGSVTAQWYDPTAGTYTQIDGSPFANDGSTTFTPPGLNSDQDRDWVLVLTTG
jgi:Protein of unknown function (DUF4038)/Putative collagen-binding domain of a collagenase